MATEKKKATRQPPKVRMNAILVAAREVFERQGYEKATVAEIVGVVEGTVFSYFSSKRILVLNVMEQFYEEVTALLSDGIKGVEGTRNQLHSIIWNHLNVVTKNASLCRVILRESRLVAIEIFRLLIRPKLTPVTPTPIQR
jgi:TetR/AcrR family transcriptional regulator, fatty acid metabolism regulator protein